MTKPTYKKDKVSLPLLTVPFTGTALLKEKNVYYIKVNLARRKVDAYAGPTAKHRIIKDFANHLQKHLHLHGGNGKFFDVKAFQDTFRGWFKALIAKDARTYSIHDEKDAITQGRALIESFLPIGTPSPAPTPAPAPIAFPLHNTKPVLSVDPVKPLEAVEQVVKLLLKDGSDVVVSFKEKLTEQDIDMLCAYLKYKVL